MCSDIVCVQQRSFQSLRRSNYQHPQCSSTSQVRNVPFEQKQGRFSWCLVKGFIFLKRRKNQFKMLLEICIVQHAETKNVFAFQSTNLPVSTAVKSGKAAFTCWILLLTTKNRQLCCLMMMLQLHIALHEKRFVTTKKQKQSPFSTPEPETNKAKIIPNVTYSYRISFGWYR